MNEVDNIILKHYAAPSNLTVEEVNILAQSVYDAEIAEDEQQQIIKKYRDALEVIYGITEENPINARKDIQDKVSEVLWGE